MRKKRTPVYLCGGGGNQTSRGPAVQPSLCKTARPPADAVRAVAHDEAPREAHDLLQPLLRRPGPPPSLRRELCGPLALLHEYWEVSLFLRAESTEIHFTVDTDLE